MKADHILIVGFGAPEKTSDVRAFLTKVAEGRAIPEHRLKEVEHHYEVIGGSPYNRYAMELKRALEEELRQRGVMLPVYIGMRNWHPFIADTMAQIRDNAHEKGLGLILAVQRSLSSCARYKDDVADAKKAAKAEEIAYDFVPSWSDHPFFIEAQADQVTRLLKQKSFSLEDTHLIFTVHSIPLDMASACDRCDYREEFNQTSRLVAEKLGASSWSQAYQSRSGNPRQPWLEPDISEELKRLAAEGKRRIAVVPIGFLFDNAEVLFDLDVEAAETARGLGLEYARVPTVMGHPMLVRLLAEGIVKNLNVR